MAGSAIERLPVERAMLNTIRAFKCYGDFDDSNIITHVLNGTEGETDYAKFMKEYIEKNYGNFLYFLFVYVFFLLFVVFFM